MSAADSSARAGFGPPGLDLAGLGQSLTACRQTAGLSRRTLAGKAGVAEKTIKNLERGSVAPSPSTVIRIAAVTELAWDPARFGYCLPVVDGTAAANCFLAQGYDPMAMLMDLIRCLRGRGGRLDQSHMYLDPKSAADWHAITEQVDYCQASLHSFPAERTAAQLVGQVRGKGVDVLALGCGSGRLETALTQHLLAHLSGCQPDLNLYLLDISQPLLVAAHKYAADLLGSTRGVNVYGVQGDFHDLPSYNFLFAGREHRRRVAYMLGGTFGNLTDEVLFVRDSLAAFRAGDLLVVDVSHAAAPTSKPEEIRRLDPRLNGTTPTGWHRMHDEWLAGPIQRYSQDLASVEIRPELDLGSCPVPGSYAVELRATVRSTSGEERTFGAFRVKRHDLAQLVATMKGLGWGGLTGYHYGDESGRPAPRSVYIFKKMEAAPCR